MIRISCPHCHTKLEQASMPPGGIVQCTQCGKKLRIPPSVGGASTAPKPPAAAQPPTVLPVTPRAPRPQAQEPPLVRAVDDDRPRRRDEDDEDRPRKRKKKGAKHSSAGIIAGSVIGTIVLGGLAILAFFALYDPRPANDFSTVPIPIGPNAMGGGHLPPPAQTPPTQPLLPFEGGEANAAANNEPLPNSQQPATFGGGSGGDGTNVYPYLLKSATLIIAAMEIPTPSGPMRSAMAGSGSVVDRKNRLVLTNHHVAGQAKEIYVFFPTYAESKLVGDKERFMNQFRGRANYLIKGKVLATDPQRDLCLVQVDRVPEGIEALPLSSAQVTPGQRVHSIGNPGDSGALWVYTSGTVRQLYHKRWQVAGLNGGSMMQCDAEVVETQSPTNHGDSGGPLVNDHGELVAVTHGGRSGAQLLSLFIDVTEARRFIETTVQTKLGAKWTSDARPPLEKPRS
jgi:S1-C subfamily serine protease